MARQRGSSPPKMKKPKKISVEVIPQHDESGEQLPLYQLLDTLIDKFHEHLQTAKIVLVWQADMKPDTDGRIVLGTCRRRSDLDRELGDVDFVIALNKDAWGTLKENQQTAVLDHELCHAQVARDKEGGMKRYAKDRPIWRLRKHDLEEFKAIVARHGMYKQDIAGFVQCAMLKAKPDLFRQLDQEAPAAKSNGTHQAAEPAAHSNGHAPAPDDSAWRKELLSDVLTRAGFTGKLIEKLADADLATLGELADFTAIRRLTDIKGVGEANAEKIEKALENHWAQRQEAANA